MNVNSKEICNFRHIFSFLQKNADVSIFATIQGYLLWKMTWLPPFFFVVSNSPCKDLLFPPDPNMMQKPLYSVGTALKVAP